MRIDRIKLATAMIRADLSVNDLAERSGLSRVTVTSVKSGKSCSRKTAEKLAFGLGLTVSDIVEGVQK